LQAYNREMSKNHDLEIADYRNNAVESLHAVYTKAHNRPRQEFKPLRYGSNIRAG
jgi:hypothetical protein